MDKIDAKYCVLALWKWADELENPELVRDMKARAERIAIAFDVETEPLRELLQRHVYRH